MNARKVSRPTLVELARDPMVRLMMASDGVTEAELVGVLTVAQRAVAQRAVAQRPVAQRPVVGRTAPQIAGAAPPRPRRATAFDGFRCNGPRPVR